MKVCKIHEFESGRQGFVNYLDGIGPSPVFARHRLHVALRMIDNAEMAARFQRFVNCCIDVSPALRRKVMHIAKSEGKVDVAYTEMECTDIVCAKRSVLFRADADVEYLYVIESSGRQ